MPERESTPVPERRTFRCLLTAPKLLQSKRALHGKFIVVRVLRSASRRESFGVAPPAQVEEHTRAGEQYRWIVAVARLDGFQFP
jgi:hypothetical protein